MEKLNLWQLRLILAHILYNSKKYSEAKQLYTEIYRFSSNLKVGELLGWTQLALGNNSEAKKWGQTALQSNPKEKSIELLLILVEEGEQKMTKLKKIVGENPQFYRASFELAQLLYKSHAK